MKPLSRIVFRCIWRYVQANLRVDYDLTDRITIGAGVRNAFDDLYSLTDGFPERGRSFFLSARLRS